MKIKLNKELINKHFVAGTKIEPGWTYIGLFPGDEAKDHRAMIGVIEYMAGMYSAELPVETDTGTLEFAYDHNAGHKAYIGDFAFHANESERIIVAANSIKELENHLN